MKVLFILTVFVLFHVSFGAIRHNFDDLVSEVEEALTFKKEFKEDDEVIQKQKCDKDKDGVTKQYKTIPGATKAKGNEDNGEIKVKVNYKCEITEVTEKCNDKTKQKTKTVDSSVTFILGVNRRGNDIELKKIKDGGPGNCGNTIKDRSIKRISSFR